MKPLIQTYDPRLQQSYETTDWQTRSRFSSIDFGFYAVYAVGLDWDLRTASVADAIRRTSRIGFVAVEPWRPVVKPLLETVSRSFDSPHERDRSIIAYFDVASDGVQRSFELRSRFGGQSSGEWCIGGSVSPLTQARRIGPLLANPWDLAHLMTEARNVAFVLELAEMNQSTMMTRLFEGFDEWLAELKLPGQRGLSDE